MNTILIFASALGALSPFKPGETILLDGIVRERIETCASNILHHLKVEESLVKPFLDMDEVQDTGRFIGCGMLLDAIVKAAAHGAGGEEMVRFKDHVLGEIYSAQAENGRISIFKNEDGLGWWDNHDQAYFLQAFCREWEYTGSERALEAAKKLGDYLVSPGRQTKVNLGIETAFTLLYRATKDERYREYMDERFGMHLGMENYARLLIDARIPHGVPLLHVYSWQARALAESQFADATGDEAPVLRESMEELWLRAFSPASSISGTMSGPTYEHDRNWGEKWNESNLGLGAWGETCVSAYAMRTLQYMFTKRAEPRFGDLYERIMYNAFFAAMSKDGTNYRYFTPFEEKGEWYGRETFCCPNNFRREIFEIPDSIFFTTADGSLAINMYIPAKLRTGALDVNLKTVYPAPGPGEISIVKGAPKRVYLRIPGWCENAKVECGTKQYSPKAGTWLEVEPGANTDITFDFPAKERFVKGQRVQSGKVARMRGPVVYGFDAEGRTVPFADETRVSTYFTPGEGTIAVDDELFSVPRWRGAETGADAETVDTGNGILWRTSQVEDFSVLGNSTDGGKTWKTVLVADPDYEGPLAAENPSLKADENRILLWFWTQNGRRMQLRLSYDEEYPSVMRDQARAVE
ncbi:MAG: glycoside hydrolase family 127 protein [Kiritimatiellae bacterium]|nr:glycoside hydrolase family 127 protein [Kiritimatiellia bacterium]